MNKWKIKTKGTAKIHTNMDIPFAIVENDFGIHFRGKEFETIEKAKEFALTYTDD